MKRAIRIEGKRLGTFKEIQNFLAILDDCYNKAYALDFIIEQVCQQVNINKSERHQRIPRVPRIIKAENIITENDRLTLVKTSFNSPGFWTAIGALNPLETLRKYIQDVHERRKDRDYREAQEKEKNNLDIQEQKIRILRDMGVPEEKIRPLVLMYVIKPREMLAELESKGLLGNAEIVDL